jgi:hypothetical protein
MRLNVSMVGGVLFLIGGKLPNSIPTYCILRLDEIEILYNEIEVFQLPTAFNHLRKASTIFKR